VALQGQFTKLQKENPLLGDKCTMSRDCYAVAVEGEVAPSDSKHFVVMSVTMPYSKSDFGGPLQAQFRAAVASAASTYPANVEIVSITEKRRRAEGSIDVETKVQYDKDEECIWSGNLSTPSITLSSPRARALPSVSVCMGARPKRWRVFCVL